MEWNWRFGTLYIAILYPPNAPTLSLSCIVSFSFNVAAKRRMTPVIPPRHPVFHINRQGCTRRDHQRDRLKEHSRHKKPRPFSGQALPRPCTCLVGVWLRDSRYLCRAEDSRLRGGGYGHVRMVGEGRCSLTCNTPGEFQG